jgi:hypothetical protein
VFSFSMSIEIGVILPPTGTDWRSGYEFAAAVRAAYPRR